MTVHCNVHNLDYDSQEKELFGKWFRTGACPECEKEMQDHEAEQEAIKARNAHISRCKRQNIEPMFWDATLETFITTTAEQEKAKEAISKMIQEKSGKIVMLGKNGTGKTHLAVCAVKALDGMIFSMYEISTRIRATYTPTAKEQEIDVVTELSHLPLLAIDEIGRTKGSDAETNWLSYIIDKRYTRGLPLILISNKHNRKNCTEKDGCSNCLENFLAEDIMSRLNEDGKLLYLTGDDYRVIKRQSAHNHATMTTGDNK